MASSSKGTIAYHEDSDADDEFERSVMTSPGQSHTESETSSEAPQSDEHTPTFDTTSDGTERPRTIISAWTSEECAQFMVSIGLRQYADLLIEHGVDGEALIALTHEELREMDIKSAGHRLKILKEVYNIKISQDVPVGPDDFVPKTAEYDAQLDMATKEDIRKLTNAILKLRDERILELEAQVTRLADDARKLRTELWPLFRMVKEREPLPYRPFDNSSSAATTTGDYNDSIVSPPTSATEVREPKSSLTRTFSKKLGLGSSSSNNSNNNKNQSPTHVPSTITEKHEPSGLQPSAAASAASNSLTASMNGGGHLHSPNTTSASSPTSPMPYHAPLAPRSYQQTPLGHFSINDSDNIRPGTVPPQLLSSSGLHSISTNPSNLPDGLMPKSAMSKQSLNSFSSTSTLIPSREMSASVPPPSTIRPSTSHTTTTITTPSMTPGTGVTAADTLTQSHSRSEKDPTSVEIFKSFRVALDDPCHKVLPAALRKYNINADWRQYALYIVYGDQERCVGLEEKPLALFKELDREGKKPMFMLRKWGGGPPSATTGETPASAGGLKTAGLVPQGFGGANGPNQPGSAGLRTNGSQIVPGGLL